jgi:O-acetylhomoserine (thiol)-lyase
MWEGTLGPEGMADAGIQPNLVRLSVGLEDERDLIDDLRRALDMTLAQATAKAF